MGEEPRRHLLEHSPLEGRQPRVVDQGLRREPAHLGAQLGRFEQPLRRRTEGRLRQLLRVEVELVPEQAGGGGVGARQK